MITIEFIQKNSYLLKFAEIVEPNAKKKLGAKMLSNAFPFAYFNVLDHLEAIYMIKCAWIWPRNEYHHKSTENIWFTDRFTDSQQSPRPCLPWKYTVQQSGGRLFH